MNISKKIKEQRSLLNLSQEALAEKVFVTRQTISSWETGKSYPDVHSLILLSKTFEITIDQLIKGDLVEMKKAVEKDDITKMAKYSGFMIIGCAVSVIIFPLSWYLGSIIGIVLASLIFVMALYFAFKVEKIKKQYDVQTYREILAFTKGETLDEISKIRESGKVKYQKILLTLGSMVFGATVSIIIFRILQAIR
jgi:transcriptional regulator with XRE-family HTH domain